MSNRPFRYLALGDSYTIGEGIPPEQRWPAQLVEGLREDDCAIDDPLIIAVTGWTTDELLEGIKKAEPEGEFDLVSLLIGVNNQYRGRDVNNYREELKQLLQIAVGKAGGNAKRLLVISISDWSVTPFAKGRDLVKIANEIDQFNAVKREEVERIGAHFIDVTAISRRDKNHLAADQLHPSGEMHTSWANRMMPAVLQILHGDGIS